MRKIIVAYSKLEDAKRIRSVLVRNGFSVLGIGTTGARALELASGDGEESLIICGYRLKDVAYRELSEMLPQGSLLLLITSPQRVGEELPDNVVFLPIPLKVDSLLQKVSALIVTSERKKSRKPPKRSAEEQELINRAKAVLMERNHMTEPEAHRYLQKCAMDSGTGIAETADMILLLIRNE
ncbi:MAG: ANTAR domain-containing protein [Eubacteriales bacterium]|nr:ANTAR domain-containing protein [Eubacteriales bacterium]